VYCAILILFMVHLTEISWLSRHNYLSYAL